MNPESKNIYDRLPEDHELIEAYQPKFLARGGDHLVYTVEDHPDVVIKASTFRIKDILHENVENKYLLNSISESQREKLEKEIAEKNSQIQQLRTYFGKEHTLSEKRYLMKVPISLDVLHEIFIDDWEKRLTPEGAGSLTEVWTSVIVQKKSAEILDPNHKGLYFGGFLEERDFELSEYLRLNNLFIVHPTHDLDNKRLFLSLQDNPETHATIDIITQAEGDESLKEALQDLIKKIISYSKDTGNILALSGEDNIILYKQQEDWNYVLVDALPVHNEPVVAVAIEAIHRYLNNEQLTKYEKTLIMKAVNFARYVNGLALCLNIEDRLNLILNEDLVKDINFADILV